MDEFDNVIKLWPLFAGSIVTVAWFIRLEAKVLYLEQDFKRYQDDYDEKLSEHKDEVKDGANKVWQKIDDIRNQNTQILTTLSRLEGKLEVRTKEN